MVCDSQRTHSSSIPAPIEQGCASQRQICGVAVWCGSPGHWVATLDDMIAEKRVRLGYVNTHTAYLLARDPAYREVMQTFTLLNDGVGLDALSYIKYGRRFEFNLNGSDFTPLFLCTTRHRFRIFLLGGKPGVAAAAALALGRIAPQHAYVGAHRGHLMPEEEPQVVELIRACGADMVIVAFGNPEQELFIGRHADALGARVTIGVGALLDFLAGRVRRAPTWMQRAHLEWVHRLAHEPGRLWKRYLLFTPLLILEALSERHLGRRWLSSMIAGALVLLGDLELAAASRS